MKVLLQQKSSGFYLKTDGGWTLNRMDAEDFLSSSKATEFCTLHKLSGVQIVLKFEEQHYDIVLPLTADRRNPGVRAAHAA